MVDLSSLRQALEKKQALKRQRLQLIKERVEIINARITEAELPSWSNVPYREPQIALDIEPEEM